MLTNDIGEFLKYSLLNRYIILFGTLPLFLYASNVGLLFKLNMLHITWSYLQHRDFTT